MKTPISMNGTKPPRVRAVLVVQPQEDEEESSVAPGEMGDDFLDEDPAGVDEDDFDDEDDDDDATGEQKDARESVSDAPWSPAPTRLARDAIRDNPDLALDIIFPTVYDEDRSKKLTDLTMAQSEGTITHQRMAEQFAKELGFDGYVYEDELQAIQLESKTLPRDISGAIDEIAGAPGAAGFGSTTGLGGGTVTPMGKKRKDAPVVSQPAPAPEPADVRRHDVSGDAKQEFRQQQRSMVSATESAVRRASDPIERKTRRLTREVRSLRESHTKLAESVALLVDSVKRLIDKPDPVIPTPPTVAPNIHVDAPAPAPAPVVNVEPPVVNVQPPVVNVEPPVVNVQPPVVNVEKPDMSKVEEAVARLTELATAARVRRIVRDENGNISLIIDETPNEIDVTENL